MASLTTLDKVREHQQKTDPSNTAQDALIEDMIPVASDLIERYCQREFTNQGTTASARLYRYEGRGVLNLAPDDLRSVTQIRIDTDGDDPTTLTSSQYRLWPTRAKDGVYTHIHLVLGASNSWPGYREVEVTGTWGWASVPDAVERATILLTMELISRTSSFRASSEFDTGSPVGPAIPLHIRSMLSSYKRYSAGM